MKNKKHLFLFLFSYFIFLLSFVFFISSCSSPTEDNTVTFSGTVTLQDTTDFSGVTVSLYKPVELDTALVRINREYPNIGVPISQETEFDHREHTPLYTTTTDKNGKWQIKAPPGEYNIVAEKEGWGWRYVFNALDKVKKIQLLKEKEIYNEQDLANYFQENRIYKIYNSSVITNEDTIIIEKNAFLLFEESIELEFQSVLYINGEENAPVRIWPLKESKNYEGIKLTGNKTSHIEYLVMKGAKIGINNQMQQFDILYSNFIDCGKGVYSEGALNISNCVFRHNISALVKLFNSDFIEKNIFYNNTTGIELSEDMSQIKLNYFFNNSTGLLSRLGSNGDVKNNDINNNNTGIKIESANPSIELNNIINNKNKGISIGFIQSNQTSAPVISYNNIINPIWDIAFSNSNRGNDIKADYNWWGSVSLNKIETKIYDGKDDGLNEYGKVIINYILAQWDNNAGIGE